MKNKTYIVAKFEVLKTVKRKGFILSTVGLPAFMILIIAFFSFTAQTSYSSPSAQKIGFVDDAGFLEPATDYIQYNDDQSAKNALFRKEISSFFIVHRDYFKTGRVSLYSREGPLYNYAPKNTIDDFMRQNLLRYGNVSEEIAKRIEQPMQQEIVILDNQGNVKDKSTILVSLLPIAITIMLALGILTSSGYLLQGIGEEKESRRGEFLLSYISAEQLLAGKIIGYGGISLIQISVWIGIGICILYASQLTGLLSGMLGSWVVYLALTYFILGFLLFSVSIACTASLASSLKEAQQLSGIITMFAILPTIFSQILFQDPNSIILQILMYFPYTSPFITVGRVSLVYVPWYEIVISVIILLITIGLVTKLSAKIFRTGMLLYGKKATIKDIISLL